MIAFIVLIPFPNGRSATISINCRTRAECYEVLLLSFSFLSAIAFLGVVIVVVIVSGFGGSFLCSQYGGLFGSMAIGYLNQIDKLVVVEEGSIADEITSSLQLNFLAFLKQTKVGITQGFGL